MEHHNSTHGGARQLTISIWHGSTRLDTWDPVPYQHVNAHQGHEHGRLGRGQPAHADHTVQGIGRGCSSSSTAQAPTAPTLSRDTATTACSTAGRP